MVKPYKAAVVIGRFEPHHVGHTTLFKHAATQADNLIIIVGSSFVARTIKNPFTFDERAAMLRATCEPMFKNVFIYGVTDYWYNNPRWIDEVSYNVDEALQEIEDQEPPHAPIRTFTQDVAIVGFHKDDSSWYLDAFPQYHYTEVAQEIKLDATTIRDDYFRNADCDTDYPLLYPVPKHVAEFLNKFRKTETFNTLAAEWKQNRDYKKPYEGLPYPPIFQTVDAAVFCRDHILVVKRRASPGKGLWALPGGFLNASERINDGIIRELLEETRIKVPREKLIIRETKTFDHPSRSQRGRTITTCGLIVLEMDQLPQTRGADDAERTKWVPRSKFYSMTDKWFEDHGSISEYMSARVDQYKAHNPYSG